MGNFFKLFLSEKKEYKSYTPKKSHKSHRYHNIYRESTNNYKPTIGEASINDNENVAAVIKARKKLNAFFTLNSNNNTNANCNDGFCKTLYKAIFNGGTRKKQKHVRRTLKHRH